MSTRLRILSAADRFLAFLMGAILIGTTLAFGGAVWWAKPVVALTTVLFVLGVLIRIVVEGRFCILKSPLTFLGLLALGLAMIQIVPLPARVARRISPRSAEVYSHGLPLGLALQDDPSLELPEPMAIRSPVTLDRPATLQWLAGATACLALFWGVSQFVDRLGHLCLVWGSIVGAFFINTAFAVVQLVSQSGALFGFIEPGKGPAFGPTLNDLISSPNATVLRPAGELGNSIPEWVTVVPDRPFLIGSLMGGPDAYLALGSLGLPLGLALLLQLVAPRGSREGLWTRLGHSSHGGLAVLLTLLTIASAFIVGLLAGPWLSLPFAFALLAVGMPSAWPTGLRWSAIALTFSSVTALAGGVALGLLWAKLPGSTPPVAAESLATAAQVWTDAWPVIRSYPLLGTGLGSFSAINPFIKSVDESHTTALSSLIQWVVESGLIGLVILCLGAAWCLWRLPGAVKRVGSADCSLAFGLIGAAGGFTLYSAVHWTVELSAVALAATAVGGTLNRWLAGGTDLFVERA